MRRDNSLETSIMLGMGGGTRKRGRPRARWLDDIKAVTNCTLTELCGSARDRDAWRKNKNKNKNKKFIVDPNTN